MTFRDYQFIIARADIARDLHALAADINADDSLDSVEKQELHNAISEKFCRMNQRAAGPQRPRWDSPADRQVSPTNHRHE